MSEPSSTLPLELNHDTPTAPDPPAAASVPQPPPAPDDDGGDEEGGEARVSHEDKGKGKAQQDQLDRYSCHICLDVPSEPVVTPCGHLHCWPCMHEWLVESNGRACPVCKAPLTVDKLVPIYAGSGDETDPRSKPIPPRPRPAGSTAAAPAYRSTSSGSSFSLQAGLFPLPGLSLGFSWPPPPAGDAGPAPGHPAVIVDGDPDSGAPFYVAQPATLVRRAAQPVDWRTALMQQAFMVLFFAVFVAITFAGAE
ncbi:uncharacterized protein RHOBADRAFT_50518 [Rhodotorula graminis WP1]|uniref:RING-type E3 ubiquitin transferase n=1 Tax=Rhodotorula graminis (strain WP1) TaxID=578459 RepID=A0A194SBN2_RHOGW|nr:uncharacterized protein RHOBADRAFT_50518 [Rhodotorula graminis WP1]KPV77994.1 hypothetical protein RHOBADRAFT_50518 [Rhodotorula graminis WP1]